MKKRNVFKKDLKELTEQHDGQKQGVGSWQLEPDKIKTADHRTLCGRMAIYSEHSGVCRRAKLPGRSVEVKKF